MKFARFLPLLVSLIITGCAAGGATKSSPQAKPEFQTMHGQLLKADSRQPLANLRIAVGDTADSRSLFGLVEHPIFAKGRTDAQGRFALAVEKTPEFKKAYDQKTLLFVVSGNRDYLGILLAQGEKPVYLVPKVAAPQ